MTEQQKKHFKLMAVLAGIFIVFFIAALVAGGQSQ